MTINRWSTSGTCVPVTTLQSLVHVELYEMKTTVVNSGFNYTAKQYAAAEVINWTGMCFFFVVLKLSLLQ